MEQLGIEPGSFGVAANRYIYIAMQYLFTKGQTPTPISIVEVITNEVGKKSIDEIGGMNYIASLQDTFITEDNLEIFCDKVKQAFTRRRICEICKQTETEMLEEKTEVLNQAELVGMLEKRVTDLSSSTITGQKDVYKMGDNTDHVLEQRAKTPAFIPGLETGWKQFDKMTGGFQPGDFVVLVARSKTGKSVTLTNWATEFGVNQQLPVLYIDTEMTSREQEDRILANLSDIPHSEITSGMYALDTEYGTAEEKRERLNVAKDKLKKGQYYHYYMPDMNIENVKLIVKKYKTQHNICALFFDYMKLTSNMATTLRSSQEYQQLGFMASALKELGGKLNIPVITSAQENRLDVKGTVKDASNVGGSDRILQNATKLVFLYNKSPEDIALQGDHMGNQQAYIAYQRNGMSDCPPINIDFNRPFLRQLEISL